MIKRLQTQYPSEASVPCEAVTCMGSCVQVACRMCVRSMRGDLGTENGMGIARLTLTLCPYKGKGWGGCWGARVRLTLGGFESRRQMEAVREAAVGAATVATTS